MLCVMLLSSSLTAADAFPLSSLPLPVLHLLWPLGANFIHSPFYSYCAFRHLLPKLTRLRVIWVHLVNPVPKGTRAIGEGEQSGSN
jgi:hypothetical protein